MSHSGCQYIIRRGAIIFSMLTDGTVYLLFSSLSCDKICSLMEQDRPILFFIAIFAASSQGDSSDFQLSLLLLLSSSPPPVPGVPLLLLLLFFEEEDWATDISSTIRANPKSQICLHEDFFR